MPPTPKDIEPIRASSFGPQAADDADDDPDSDGRQRRHQKIPRDGLPYAPVDSLGERVLSRCIHGAYSGPRDGEPQLRAGYYGSGTDPTPRPDSSHDQRKPRPIPRGLGRPVPHRPPQAG